MLEELALQVDHLIPLFWFHCEGYFKGSPVIKYTYLACQVVLCFAFAIYGSFVFIVYWEVYSDSCQTSKIELFGKLVNEWKLLTFFLKTLHLRRLIGFWMRLSWIKSKLYSQVLLYIAIWNNMYLLPFQYDYTPIRKAKRLTSSQTLVFSPDYIILGVMKIWKTLQRVRAASKRFSWEINFSKMFRNLER